MLGIINKNMGLEKISTLNQCFFLIYFIKYQMFKYIITFFDGFKIS